MTRLRISRAAREDLERILSVSEARWGESARARYEKLLVAAFSVIAGNPSGPLTRDRAADLPGARSFHTREVRHRSEVKQPVHVVFYRVHATAIEIVRVLHERMDPARELPAKPPRSR